MYRKWKEIKVMLATGILFIGITDYAVAQTNGQPDSSFIKQSVSFQPARIKAKSFLLPAGIITTGALGISGEFVISDPEIKEERDANFATFHTSIDNYLQFAPVALGYAMLINNKEHSFWHYTEKVALTEVIMTGLVYSTKYITKVPRPDTGAPTSFPSGHTVQAFAGATLFCDEFAQHKTWLTVTVYSGAAAVGALRILNNRHWASDVVAGAGFGILSAKLSEWIIEPHNKNHLSLYTYQF